MMQFHLQCLQLTVTGGLIGKLDTGSPTYKFAIKIPKRVTSKSATMEVKWTETNEKKHRIDNEQILQDSLVIPDNSIPSQTEQTSQTTTDDTKVSSTVIFVDVILNKTKGGVTGPDSISSPCSVEKDQPKLPSAPLPTSVEDCKVYDGSEPFRFINRSQESLKTMTVYTEPDDDDLCAAILLACLFCHPLDCLLNTMRGCNECVWSLCSYLCGCNTSTLQPLLDITSHCGCLGVHCCQCECPVCDICLQATECLDLAMEISQMLYH